MSEQDNQADYIQAFSSYLRKGDASELHSFLANPDEAKFLSIYRNGFYKACLNALKANFVCLHRLIGDDEFDRLAVSYIDHYPPVQSSLVAYGMMSDLRDGQRGDVIEEALSFPLYLQQRTQDPNVIQSISKQGLYELTILDQIWLNTLNKAESGGVALSYVQNLLEQGQDLSLIPFKLVSSASMVMLNYDVFDSWCALRFDEEKEKDKESEIEIAWQPVEKLNSVLFWQTSAGVQAKPLSEIESSFFQGFMQSQSFQHALNKVSEENEHFDLASFFADLLQASLLKVED